MCFSKKKCNYGEKIPTITNVVSICILPVWVFVYLYTISVKMDKPIGINYTVLTKINSVNCKYFKNDLKSRLSVFNTKVVVRNMGGGRGPSHSSLNGFFTVSIYLYCYSELLVKVRM